MAHIRSRKHPNSSHLLALVAAALPVTGMAQESETALPAMTVKANAEVPYKAEKSASPKFTQPLVDTPQTVQVIKKEVFQEQGAATLMEALRNTPGITMNFGEQGNSAAGDTFNMRGFSTQSSMFVDGVRDLGTITRDVFNLEQVEVVKGPAGADIGRGSQSGYINLISKLPQATDINSASIGLGSADYKRVTADFNKQVSDGVAVRLNVMAQDSGVAKRDHVENQSVGVAPGVAFGLNSPTRLYLYSLHVRQDNMPDGGLPAVGLENYNNVAKPAANSWAKVDRSNFYGNKSDNEKVEADMLTAKFEHDFSDKTKLTNITRYGHTEMDRRMTGLGSIGATVTPTTYTVSRQGTDQSNSILANQTNLVTEFMTGSFAHTLSGGLEFMSERQRVTAITSATVNNVNLYNPAVWDMNFAPLVKGATTYGEMNTAALYVFDTMKLSESWLINGGGRIERYKTESAGLDVSGNLFSYKLGAVYKPAPNGSIYTAFAHSLTPAGSGFTLSATATNQQNPSMDPQVTDNFELGTKWDLLDKRLLLTAAIFRTENDKQVTQDAVSGTWSQSGKTRVDGIELSAVGQITQNWQLSAGVAYMDATVLKQRSGTGSSSVETSSVQWAPDLTATLWSTYALGDFTVGGGVRYVSEQNMIVSSSGQTGGGLNSGSMTSIPSYTVVDAMAGYKLSKNANLRLNVYNLFDREYITSVNKNSNRVAYGIPLSAMLTANFQF